MKRGALNLDPKVGVVVLQLVLTPKQIKKKRVNPS